MNIFKYMCIFLLFCLFFHENLRSASLESEEAPLPFQVQPWKSKYGHASSAINPEELNEVLRQRSQRKKAASFKDADTKDDEDSEDESGGVQRGGREESAVGFASPLAGPVLAIEGVEEEKKEDIVQNEPSILERYPPSLPSNALQASAGQEEKKASSKDLDTKSKTPPKRSLGPNSSTLFGEMFPAPFNMGARGEGRNLMGSVFASSKPPEPPKKGGFLTFFSRKKQGPSEGTS